jgi:5-methylcytosine-specific restriction endonuclease McrA
MILSPKERCPIHKQQPFTCPCHRVQRRARLKGSKWETVRIGVRRIKDQFADHRDGYRYKYSAGEMRKVLLRKVEEQHGLCALCGEPFTTLVGVVPDHIKPKGLGGARADDRPENIQAAHHHPCNFEKGSKRLPEGEAA